MKLTDLTNLRQRNDESVATFIQRFRDVKNRCFSLVLSDQQLAEVAFQGLLHTSRRSMLLRSSTASVRWLIGWQGRPNRISRREATSRRKSILLTAQTVLIPMMIRWWDRLNGSRTTKSQFHVLLVSKNPRSMGLISPKLTRSSIVAVRRAD